MRFLLHLTNLARERLQIDTDLLRIITSTADELSGSTNTDDLERPWTPKIWFFSDFFAIFGCGAHLFSLKDTGDRPRQPAYEIKLMLSRVSWALSQISCFPAYRNSAWCLGLIRSIFHTRTDQCSVCRVLLSQYLSAHNIVLWFYLNTLFAWWSYGE